MKNLGVLLNICALGVFSTTSSFACNAVSEADRIVKLSEVKEKFDSLKNNDSFVCYKITDPNVTLNQITKNNSPDKERDKLLSQISENMRRVLFIRASYYRKSCSNSKEFDGIIGPNRDLKDNTGLMEARIDLFSKSINAVIDNDSVRSPTKNFFDQSISSLECDKSCFTESKNGYGDPIYKMTTDIDSIEFYHEDTRYSDDDEQQKSQYVCLTKKRIEKYYK